MPVVRFRRVYEMHSRCISDEYESDRPPSKFRSGWMEFVSRFYDMNSKRSEVKCNFYNRRNRLQLSDSSLP